MPLLTTKQCALHRAGASARATVSDDAADDENHWRITGERVHNDQGAAVSPSKMTKRSQRRAARQRRLRSLSSATVSSSSSSSCSDTDCESSITTDCSSSIFDNDVLLLSDERTGRGLITTTARLCSSSSITSIESEELASVPPRRHVSFDTKACVRIYSQILGEHPCCTEGPPLELSWEYQEERLETLQLAPKYTATTATATAQHHGPSSCPRLSAQDRRCILQGVMKEDELRKAQRRISRDQRRQRLCAKRVQRSFFATPVASTPAVATTSDEEED